MNNGKYHYQVCFVANEMFKTGGFSELGWVDKALCQTPCKTPCHMPHYQWFSGHSTPHKSFPWSTYFMDRQHPHSNTPIGGLNNGYFPGLRGDVMGTCTRLSFECTSVAWSHIRSFLSSVFGGKATWLLSLFPLCSGFDTRHDKTRAKIMESVP